MISAPVLSVAIVNWNTRALLLDALASIYNAPRPSRLR